MRWSIIEAGDGTWQVVDERGNVVVGEQPSREAAVSALQGLTETALAGLPEGGIPAGRGARFRMSFVEGERTVDGRIVDQGATVFDRPPPLPLMLLKETSEGHMGAQLSGVIDTVRREGNVIVSEGNFDAGSDAGIEHERLVREGVMTTWSPDFGDADIEMEVIGGEESTTEEDGLLLLLSDADMLMHLKKATFLGGTGVPFPALTSARIEVPMAALAAGGFPITPLLGRIEIVSDVARGGPVRADMAYMVGEGAPEAFIATDHTNTNVVTLHAAGIAPRQRPPAAWFNDPQLPGPTPLTVDDDGRVYGHLAQFGVCHTSFLDRCVLAPRSRSDYAYFRTGSVTTDDGERVRVGQLTFGTGHADLEWSPSVAKAHYDGGPGARVMADVACGEDRYGIWIAGAMRPDVTDAERAAFEAQALSGDWRPQAGGLELIAALSVPVPGFPILASGRLRPRSRIVHGEVVALVAAGALAPASDCGCGGSEEALQHALDQMQRMQRIIAPLTLTAAQEALAALRGI